ncbi:hypothetical protein EYF80_062982 [Liparis tanakae]|uniref:Uncharacterized protein n=1 Tax=Liparis tanakae TaxID=230148 RepID=A0A4Z2EDD5_9TELE|nr:hypothetical protein EYF80_062982 [Liparis tanakae]
MLRGEIKQRNRRKARYPGRSRCHATTPQIAIGGEPCRSVNSPHRAGGLLGAGPAGGGACWGRGLLGAGPPETECGRITLNYCNSNQGPAPPRVAARWVSRPPAHLAPGPRPTWPRPWARYQHQIPAL